MVVVSLFGLTLPNIPKASGEIIRLLLSILENPRILEVHSLLTVKQVTMAILEYRRGRYYSPFNRRESKLLLATFTLPFLKLEKKLLVYCVYFLNLKKKYLSSGKMFMILVWHSKAFLQTFVTFTHSYSLSLASSRGS